MPTITSPMEAERLVFLIEEASEVIKIATKILRFGYHNYHPDCPSKVNRWSLAEEIGHFEAAVHLLESYGDIAINIVEAQRRRKLDTLDKYLTFNQTRSK